MDWNDWKIACRQLAVHWRRSGIQRIPAPQPTSAEQTSNWLSAHERTLVESRTVEDELSAEVGRSVSNDNLLPNVSLGVSASISASSNFGAGSPARSVAKAFVSNQNEPIGAWITPSKSDQEREKFFAELSQEVAVCRKCEDIACRRHRTVFGVGPVKAKLVMFGEAPGAEEDKVGEPFVGAAGQLLDKILVASGMQRSQVYIMNALRCRPPNNRTPSEAEIENCRPFFEAQLETIQPDYIVCWGSVAVRAVLQSSESIGRLRGRFHSYRGARVLVTYHPAYLLRNPDAKKLTWADMQFLMKELGITRPQ